MVRRRLFADEEELFVLGKTFIQFMIVINRYLFLVVLVEAACLDVVLREAEVADFEPNSHHFVI